MTKLLKRADLLLILTLLCLSFAPLLFLSGRSGTVYADITVDGRLYRRVPLSGRHGREEFTVQTPDGSNTICVEGETIAVTEADCPDEICIETGRASRPGDIIACLPHRLIIEVKGDAADDEPDLIRMR